MSLPVTKENGAIIRHAENFIYYFEIRAGPHMRTTCISHPENERLVLIRKWQLEFCDGDHAGAALLSFFEYWHNWKLDSDRINRKTNNIAERHGEPRSLSEDVFQYHSYSEISDGILNLYSAKTIGEKTIKLLVAKKAISIHSNPNPKLYYDKTQYFKFHPEVCIEWLKTSYKSKDRKKSVSNEQNCDLDTEKLPNASRKNSTTNGKNSVYRRTEINIRESNKLINADDSFFEEKEEPAYEMPDMTQVIIDALIEKGMARTRFSTDAVMAIQRLHEAGAVLGQFIEGYDIASFVTKDNGFGISYLIKTVDTIMQKSKNPTGQPASWKKPKNETVPVASPPKERVYENDFRHAQSWAGDILAMTDEELMNEFATR